MLSAQEKNISRDTLSKVKDTLHSPQRAALLSTILPGAGQVYNHKAKPKGKKNAIWKIPIIYGGLGATAFLAIENHILQRDFRAEYEFRVENPNSTNLPGYENFDNQGILTFYEQSRRTRDLMIFAFVAVYGLNVLDAYVEAHFVNFDVSKDLSMSIRPTMPTLTTPGIALSFNFR
jgi:hypothetical protein